MRKKDPLPMLTVLNTQHSIANQFLLELRDKVIQRDREKFRDNTKRLGELMAYEISKTLAYQTVSVETPLGSSTVQVLKEKPVLITVMRAGLVYFQGFQHYFGQSDCGFIGAYRKEGGSELTIRLDDLATPTLENRTLLLIDPMLATGMSFINAIDSLAAHGKPSFIHIASLVAAPEGVKYIEEKLELPYRIWTWALDEKLNAQSYIVPGLGDAGDLSYGDKL
jgi:uracil phosphoribosyltransferase